MCAAHLTVLRISEPDTWLTKMCVDTWLTKMCVKVFKRLKYNMCLNTFKYAGVKDKAHASNYLTQSLRGS